MLLHFTGIKVPNRIIAESIRFPVAEHPVKRRSRRIDKLRTESRAHYQYVSDDKRSSFLKNGHYRRKGSRKKIIVSVQIYDDITGREGKALIHGISLSSIFLGYPLQVWIFFQQINRTVG